jgi:hypothetical protein
MPVLPDVPVPCVRELARLLLVVDRPDELGRVGEGRVVGSDEGAADQACNPPAGQSVLERLYEPVSDHSLGLGADYVERIGV